MIALIDNGIVKEIGNTWLSKQGYLMMSLGKQKAILVHRYIAQIALGREFKKNELVHHVDENKLNNKKDNLVICDNVFHHILHARTDVINDGYRPDLHAYCSGCKTYHFLEAFAKSKNRWNGVHNICREVSNKLRNDAKYNQGKFDWRARLKQQYRRIATNYTKREISWLSKEVTGL